MALPLPPAGTPDPGVELRLDLLAEALVAAVEGGAAESVEVRILAGPDEWPALAAALEARARASGHPLLHVEPPPRVPHALREPSSRKRRQAAAGDPRPAVK